MKSPTALALLSSGLDSSVALAMAQRQGTQVALALTFDYGQRAAPRELAQAARVAAHFGVPHRTLALPWFTGFHRGGGLLQSGKPLPRPAVAELSDRGFSTSSAQAVWVPNRNGVFLEIAAGFAEDQCLDALIVGFNREEAATFPDNSTAYMQALSGALAYSTANGVRVVSPTAELNKIEIVREALAMEFPLELLWSCYESFERMCGRCESCMRLKRALGQNQIPLEGKFEDARL